MFLDYSTAKGIVDKYGSPVYVYSEKILRERCREMLGAFKDLMRPSYSVKANTNLTLMRIIHEEGFFADAMSPGEIFMSEKAGFKDSDIFYIGNNVSREEMQYAVDRDILVSVDSLSQLEMFGQINPGGEVAIRFNPGYGLGAGHDKKVITAGHETKFGVQAELYTEIKPILKKYNLRLVGINQHIGSLFLDPIPYVDAARALLDLILEHFPGLDFVDFGGGFGIPYMPDENRLDFNELRTLLLPVCEKFVEKYDNKNVHFKCEPGRYVSAECCALVGTVYSIKDNYGSKYVGTDIGFNVLMRHVLYGSYHGMTVLGGGDPSNESTSDDVIVVGNICESGDIIADKRNIGTVRIGDLIAVENAGAYGFSMSSNYNCRLRPAEVLIKEDGSLELIRRADTLDDLISHF
jgi:diaminopimelate decarboxylase